MSRSDRGSRRFGAVVPGDARLPRRWCSECRFAVTGSVGVAASGRRVPEGSAPEGRSGGGPTLGTAGAPNATNTGARHAPLNGLAAEPRTHTQSCRSAARAHRLRSRSAGRRRARARCTAPSKLAPSRLCASLHAGACSSRAMRSSRFSQTVGRSLWARAAPLRPRRTSRLDGLDLVPRRCVSMPDVIDGRECDAAPEACGVEAGGDEVLSVHSASATDTRSPMTAAAVRSCSCTLWP